MRNKRDWEFNGASCCPWFHLNVSLWATAIGYEWATLLERCTWSPLASMVHDDDSVIHESKRPKPKSLIKSSLIHWYGPYGGYYCFGFGNWKNYSAVQCLTPSTSGSVSAKPVPAPTWYWSKNSPLHCGGNFWEKVFTCQARIMAYGHHMICWENAAVFQDGLQAYFGFTCLWFFVYLSTRVKGLS